MAASCERILIGRRRPCLFPHIGSEPGHHGHPRPKPANGQAVRDFQPSARPLLGHGELLARRGAERRRRVRRRWFLFGMLTPLVVVFVYFGVSYASYMLKPTSETFTERSAEWVRDDAPFGNSIIDTAEHYTASAPRKGGPGLKRLPSVGLNPARPPSSIPGMSPTRRRRSNRCSPRRCPAKVSGTAPAHRSTAARRCW